MMTNRHSGRRLASFLLLILVPVAAAAESDAIGTSVFQFLKIGVGARPMGMGGAFTAVADDANAIHWNAAGLAVLQLPEGTTNYLSYFADVNSGGAAFAQPVSRRSTVGFAAQFQRVGGIQTTTNANPTGEGLEQFALNDLAFSIAYATRVADRIYGGANFSYIYEGVTALNGYSSTAGTIDLGLLYRSGVRHTNLAVALRHLGGQLSFYRFEQEDLPLTLVVGVAGRPFMSSLVLALDLEKSRDNDAGVNVGGEYEVVRDFFVRLGHRSIDARVGDAGTSNTDLAGWTFGVGVSGRRRYKIDYAYSSFSDLGDAHRFSLAYIFR